MYQFRVVWCARTVSVCWPGLAMVSLLAGGEVIRTHDCVQLAAWVRSSAALPQACVC
jgi:hypothetical protein